MNQQETRLNLWGWGRLCLISNGVSALAVWLLTGLGHLFQIHHWADFVFLMLVLQWGLAILMWTSVRHQHSAALVRRREEQPEDLLEKTKENKKLAMQLFMAGIPAFLVCFLSYWLAV